VPPRNPRETSARYPIRAVSKLTGLGIDTLRAWERRHDAVTPVRDDRGRMYSDADVARLRLLRDAVERGHSIGRLAALDDDGLRRLLAPVQAVSAPAPAVLARTSPDTSGITAALQHFDAAGIDQEIARLAAVLRPVDLLRDVLMPALVQVGDDWYRGRAGIAQEHLMSSAVRHILGSFLRLHARRDAPTRLLFATLSGDRHEIGTLGAALLAASSGLGVAYLGPDLPARALVDSVQPAGAQVLVLGMTMATTGKTKERELRAIVRGLPKSVELWAGGRGALRYGSIISPRGLVLADYAALQQELIRLGGRVA
jgi:DNA-binding transcriptional MerR regulator